MRAPLPIDPALPEAIGRLRDRRILVLTAPPGAGKTTRLPLALLDSGLLGSGALWLLQPRRVAARAAARRLAWELGEEVGGTAGYLTRDESRSSPRTRILVVTEGILTRRILADPALPGISAVMLDEFHERSRHADLAISLLREVRATLREDLLLVVASATLDAGRVAAFLDDGKGAASAVSVEGGLFPVDVRHADRVDDRPLPLRASLAIRRALEEVPRGDVLAFLPGAGEIRRTAEPLAGLEGEGVLVIPLHGELSSVEQDLALQPLRDGRRKVVLATNVAETSLTIEGVSVVVDGGQARVLRYDPRSGLDRLVLSRISRASATQRSGRAGRLGPGVAYRLYTRDEERAMPAFEEPELVRADIASTLLDVLSWRAADPAGFDWFEAPPTSHLSKGLALLRRLGLVAPAGFEVTPLGRRAAGLPLSPRLAVMLLKAHEAGRARDGSLLAALLSERDVLSSARAFGPRADRASEPSDLLLRADLLEEAEAGGLRDSLLETLGLERGAVRSVLRLRDRLLSRLGARGEAGSRSDSESRLRLVLSGYPDRVARRRASTDTFALLGGRALSLDRGSVVRESPLVLALETAGGDGTPERIRLASAIEEGWLRELPGSPVRETVTRFWDAERELVAAERRVLYEDLVVSEQPIPVPLDAETEALLLAQATRDPGRALTIDERARSVLDRLAFLAAVLPETGLAADGKDRLRDLLPRLVAGRRRFTELRAVDISEALLDALSWEHRKLLAAEAPESIEVPTGRHLPLRYGGEAPVLAVKLQELFGLAETPRVARGRVSVVLELLSPAGRPVQVTRDLRSFWSTTYPAVRKELRGRYPKHPWPEDPWNAPPQRGTKKQEARRS